MVVKTISSKVQNIEAVYFCGADGNICGQKSRGMKNNRFGVA